MKCMGSVRGGERIYATVDIDNRGKGIPELHLPHVEVLSKPSILLGEKKASHLSWMMSIWFSVLCVQCSRSQR